MKHLLVLTLTVLLSSCATINYREHMVKQPAIPSRGLPPISIDDAASMIAISTKDEKPAAIEASDYSRSDILDGIEAYWNRYAGHGEKIKARVIISSSIDQHPGFGLIGGLITIPTVMGGTASSVILSFKSKKYLFLTIPLAGAYYLVGGPTGHATAIANVVIDFAGKRISGSGHGSCYAGLYYPGDPEQCAFSKAVTDAVRNAVRRSF